MYVDRPPHVTLPTDSYADEYSKLLPRAFDPFRILQVTEHSLTVDENGMPNSISIDQATLAERSTNHPRGSKSSKISSENETTLSESNSITETRTTFSRSKDFYAEKGLPIRAHTAQETSN